MEKTMYELRDDVIIKIKDLERQADAAKNLLGKYNNALIKCNVVKDILTQTEVCNLCGKKVVYVDNYYGFWRKDYSVGTLYFVGTNKYASLKPAKIENRITHKRDSGLYSVPRYFYDKNQVRDTLISMVKTEEYILNNARSAAKELMKELQSYFSKLDKEN